MAKAIFLLTINNTDNTINTDNTDWRVLYVFNKFARKRDYL